jgi:hypothetical protein
MEIAPGVSAADWAALDPDLDQPHSPRWVEAVEILRKRIEGRYLKPAKLLLDDDKPKPWQERRHGFAIIAIDCLLIETFQSFIEGETDPEFMSGLMFRTFLTSRPSFAPHFTPDTAKNFYKDFRCGILHQAEIKRDSKVWSVGDMVTVEPNGMTINRTEFHEALVTEFNAYLADLSNPANTDLRENFRKKMKFIARMT